MATHFHPLKISDIRKETDDCVSIAFEIPADLQSTFGFLPGQNITLRKFIDGNEVRRSYSICSIPSEKELRVAVKRMNGGVFSSHANEQLKPGDIIDVMAPSGMFHLPVEDGQKKSYLAIAAGSGITPILSIIRSTLEAGQSEFTLVYGNRDRQSIIFREQLNQLKNRYISRFNVHHIFSREQTELPLYNGRIDAQKIMELGRLIPFTNMDEILLCGPEEMIRVAKDTLTSLGVAEKKIHYELFHAPGVKATSIVEEEQKSSEEEKSEVTVKLDGAYFSFELGYQSASILDAALRQGADLPYACKGGVCATCKAKLLEGSVEMDANYALEADELGAGYILTCQSHPRSKKIVVDFDVK